MKPLIISDIFSNFNFYKENYLNIIADTEAYRTIVQDAYIHAWPFKKQQLYLGDLLQLWFAKKWTIDQSSVFFLNQHLFNQSAKLNHSDQFYLYQINGNTLTGKNQSKVWSLNDNTTVSLTVDNVLKYLCVYKGTSYVKANNQTLISI